MKMYIIDFSGTNNIKESISHPAEIFIETKDGGNAYKEIGEIMPDIILINYADKPKHGIQTAQAIKQRKKTAAIPIYFIDGEPEEIAKIDKLGLSIRKEQIDIYIQKTRNISP